MVSGKARGSASSSGMVFGRAAPRGAPAGGSVMGFTGFGNRREEGKFGGGRADFLNPVQTRLDSAEISRYRPRSFGGMVTQRPVDSRSGVSRARVTAPPRV